MKKIKRRIYWGKVVALILLILEIAIAIRINNHYVKGDLNLWRIYTGCVLMIPVNVIIIFSKRK